MGEPVSLARLTVCEWSGARRSDVVVEHPGWAAVEAAIRALNGTTHNDVYLYPTESDTDTYLCVGGGSGRYIVSGATSAGEFPTLVDLARTGEPEERIVVGGQPGDYPGHWIVDLDAALKAARAFYDAGAFTGDVQWVRE